MVRALLKEVYRYSKMRYISQFPLVLLSYALLHGCGGKPTIERLPSFIWNDGQICIGQSVDYLKQSGKVYLDRSTGLYYLPLSGNEFFRDLIINEQVGNSYVVELTLRGPSERTPSSVDSLVYPIIQALDSAYGYSERIVDANVGGYYSPSDTLFVPELVWSTPTGSRVSFLFTPDAVYRPRQGTRFQAGYQLRMISRPTKQIENRDASTRWRRDTSGKVISIEPHQPT